MGLLYDAFRVSLMIFAEILKLDQLPIHLSLDQELSL